MAKPKRVHYVDNKRLLEEICRYKDAQAKAKKEGTTPPRIPEYVGECIVKIANKLATKPCFVSYHYKEEMISDGIENCILYFDDFNPYYVNPNMPNYTPNPFAYFTQIIYFAFIRRIGKEHKNRYTIYKSFQEAMIHDQDLMFDSDGNHLIPAQLYDNINDFMGRFEEKENKKKQKRKPEERGLDRFEEDK